MVNEKLSAIAQKLWDLDENKMVRNKDYVLDLQNVLNVDSESHGGDDEETKEDMDKIEEDFGCLLSRPLYKEINIKKILKIPTYRKFIMLLDNYIADTDIQEELTEEDVQEEVDFIDAIYNTKVMQETHQFLIDQGKASEDEQEFRNMLIDIWFEFYSRSSNEEVQDSSAFEHVFVGEIRGEHKVLGFHNWIDYYFKEKQGLVSYMGYIPSKTIYDENSVTDDPGVLAIKFKMDGIVKPLGGFIIGSSPEFEMALYTIIFLCSGQKTHLKFSNIEIIFECFKMERNNKKVIATLFPTI